MIGDAKFVWDASDITRNIDVAFQRSKYYFNSYGMGARIINPTSHIIEMRPMATLEKREVSSIRYLDVKDMCGSGLRQCQRAHESRMETLISFNGFKSRKGQEHNVARDAKPTDGPSGLGNRLVVRGLAEGLEGKSTAQEPCGPDG